ncbi:MAG: JAB domain-containing protein [Eubacteriales bacterium]|nr:JAB domain-containing protein [Eubacteriales bacterium]
MADGHRERLKQQFIKTDYAGMSDHSILELLLTYAIPRRETNSIAHALIARFGSLEGVTKASVQELQLVDGVGESTAVMLRAVFITAQRLLMNTFYDKKGRVRLRTMEESSRYAMALFMDDKYETLRLVCLDKNFFVINTITLGVGTLESVTVNYRKIIEQALNNAASSIILMHNHPIGIPLPSEDDILVYKDVQDICKSLGLDVLDYLIVGDSSVHCCRSDRVCFFPNLASSYTMDASDLYESMSVEPCSKYNAPLEPCQFPQGSFGKPCGE